MNNDEREERIAIVAEGCKVSQEDAEIKVQEMENDSVTKVMTAIANKAASDTFSMVASAILGSAATAQCLTPVPPRCHRQDI